MRFVLKVITVFIVAAAVFGYYFWDLRRDTLPTSKPSKVLVGGVSLVILVSIISGFLLWVRRQHSGKCVLMTCV